jgi:subtilisin family serine protease
MNRRFHFAQRHLPAVVGWLGLVICVCAPGPIAFGQLDLLPVPGQRDYQPLESIFDDPTARPLDLLPIDRETSRAIVRRDLNNGDYWGLFRAQEHIDFFDDWGYGPSGVERSDGWLEREFGEEIKTWKEKQREKIRQKLRDGDSTAIDDWWNLWDLLDTGYGPSGMERTPKIQDEFPEDYTLWEQKVFGPLGASAADEFRRLNSGGYGPGLESQSIERHVQHVSESLTRDKQWTPDTIADLKRDILDDPNLSPGDKETLVGQIDDLATGRRRPGVSLQSSGQNGLPGPFRMPDATNFSIDVATANARNASYYGDPNSLQPVDGVPGVPAGAGITARTFRYLALPRFPGEIDSGGIDVFVLGDGERPRFPRGIGTLPGGIPVLVLGDGERPRFLGGIGVFFPGRTGLGLGIEDNSGLEAMFDPTRPDRSLEVEYVAFAALGGSQAPPVNSPLVPVSPFGLPGGRIDLVGITLDVFGPKGLPGGGGIPIAPDADNDGVSDEDEKKRGTDPNKKDTDGDGIDDLHDRQPLGPRGPIVLLPEPGGKPVISNPPGGVAPDGGFVLTDEERRLVAAYLETLTAPPMHTVADVIAMNFPDADADEDGVSDEEEKKRGTDPNKKDTDGDGIDDLHDPQPRGPLGPFVDLSGAGGGTPSFPRGPNDPIPLLGGHTLQEVIDSLHRPGFELVHLQSIAEGMEAIYTSNLVILPTQVDEPDCDGDGVPDAAETELGTDPNRPTTFPRPWRTMLDELRRRRPGDPLVNLDPNTVPDTFFLSSFIPTGTDLPFSPYAAGGDHSALQNLNGDTHTQYMDRSGARSMSGNLGLGGDIGDIPGDSPIFLRPDLPSEKMVHDAFDGFLAMGKMSSAEQPMAQKIMNSLKLEQQGASTVLSLNIRSADIMALVEQAMAASGGSVPSSHPECPVDQFEGTVEETYSLSPASTDHFRTSRGSWGQPGDDQWTLGKIGLTQELHEQTLAEIPDNQRPVIVAVIDSGVDLAHPELWGQLWRNRGEIPFNQIDDDGNGYVDDVYGYNTQANNSNIWDDNGHGTAVAGIIAARWDGRGMAGVAPNCRLMIVKAFNAAGKSDAVRVALAIRYAVLNGAKIIHISAESDQPIELDQAMIDWTRKQGVLVVAAAGSRGRDTAKIAPAGLRGVLTVGAVDKNDQRAKFSGWGREVDLVAPGVDILSLRARGTDFMFAMSGPALKIKAGDRVADSRWYRADGTSFAAPLVTGAAALVWAQNPKRTAEQIERQLLMSCDDVEGPGWDVLTGAGRLNVAKAAAADPDHLLVAKVLKAEVRQRNGRRVLTVSGEARGTHFADRSLQLAYGKSPAANDWRTIESSRQSVADGELGQVPGESLNRKGTWHVRCVVRDTRGTTREASTTFEIE